MITLWHWHNEPALVGGILIVGWLYVLLAGPLRERIYGVAGVSPAFPRLRAVLFGSGVVSLYLAVGSPLDALGENFLFSAHMLQHNVLMYITAPLFVAGVPSWMYDTAFTRWRWIEATWKALVHPVVAGALFTAVFSVWHVPLFYEAALHNKPLHIFEHLTMLATSMLMWWPILSTSRHLRPVTVWAQCLYVFALMVAQTPVFGILVFAEDVLYPTYEYAARLSWIDMEPLDDQILGGVVMKTANMCVSLMILGRAFFAWNAQQPEAWALVRVDRHVQE